MCASLQAVRPVREGAAQGGGPHPGQEVGPGGGPAAPLTRAQGPPPVVRSRSPLPLRPASVLTNICRRAESRKRRRCQGAWGPSHALRGDRPGPVCLLSEDRPCSTPPSPHRWPSRVLSSVRPTVCPPPRKTQKGGKVPTLLASPLRNRQGAWPAGLAGLGALVGQRGPGGAAGRPVLSAGVRAEPVPSADARRPACVASRGRAGGRGVREPRACAHPTGTRGVRRGRGDAPPRPSRPRAPSPARRAVAFVFSNAVGWAEGGWLVSRGTSGDPVVRILLLVYVPRRPKVSGTTRQDGSACHGQNSGVARPVPGS